MDSLRPYELSTHRKQLSVSTYLLAAIVILAVMFPSLSQAQGNFVYVNNQSATNSVLGYSVSPAGALTPITGSPFSTRGRGARVNCYALDRIVISPINNLLFVANSGDMTISAFQINTATGALTLVAGSPFASGLSLDSCQGMSLAATPDGKFLMASSNGQIKTFAVSPTGTLTLASTMAACCTPMDSMKISANGSFLAVADANSVSLFTIDSSGLLTPVIGSPFPKTGTGSLAGLDFNACSNGFLYGGEASGLTNIADAWAVDPSGVLTPLVGSPFSAPSGVNSNVVAMTPDNSFLFESNQATASVDSFALQPNGTLATVGKFGGTGSLHTPGGLATDRSGTFLYVADDPFGVATFRISGAGALSLIKDLAITSPIQIQGVTAYPPRSCSSADMSIAMTASPNPVFVNGTVTYSLTITNNGPDPASFTVTDILPTGLTFSSCTASAGGNCNGSGVNRFISWMQPVASGTTETVSIVATVNSTVANNTSLVNTASVSNSSAVDPNTANNSATVTVTAVKQVATKITVPTATGPYGGTATLTATLAQSANNAPVPGETIKFDLNGVLVGTAVTDANGIATVTGVPLGTLSVGTHTGAIVATFTGDTQFSLSQGTGNLTVTKALLTVTADNQTRVYGDPNPTLTYTFSGFVNGDTQAVVSGTASCTTTATQASPVGTYPITCTQGTLAATNYDFKFVDGTLTITPAPLTVTVANATRAYGDPNPIFTGTITGIKNGDNITATYSTTATITSPVGTYPITATLVDPNNLLPNYSVTVNNGTLTVTPAALIVSANNAARFYGDPNPAFSGTIAGIKNNDPITAVYTTTATPTSPVGTYPIIPTLSDNGSGALANYTVTVNNGSLTVSAAPLTVTAGDASRPYGQPNPVFTGTIAGLKNNDPITASYSTTATAASPAGTYPIVPTVSDGGTGVLKNYTVTLVNGTLTVTQAVLTVNVNSASMIYGDPLPVLTGTINGIVNGDNITAIFSTTATSASPVGTYPITATLSDNGTGALANYSVVINNGVLTISGAPLTVSVNSATRLYGDPNPVFSGTILGIKNGDPITAVFSTTADPTSAVGTYPIIATLSDGGTGKLANYAVTINNGTLTVNPAPLSVTADNATKLFDTVNPPLSGVIAGIKNSDPITATYATTAIATSPVGTYAITPTLADPAGKLGNYTVTSNNGILTVNPAPTANFVFVNNQSAAGNGINGYSVAADGTLTALAGSPVATGGLGANVACSSVNRLALSIGNNLLFVSNGGDQTISGFSINPASGALTAAGAPVASGLTLDACNGISLAATPDGQFLMASSNGQIKTFSIGAGGVLTAVSSAANPATPNSSMKISANGQFLAVSNGNSVSVYTINGDGSLAAVAGSPFAETGTATLAGLDFNSTSGLLFGAEASATGAFADAFTVGANGALSAVAGSPFSDTNLNSNVVLLSPADGFLFASNSGSANVSSYAVGAGGILTGVTSSGSLHSPVGMATDRSGTMLYVADDTFGVAVLRIDGAGSLSQLNDTAISGAGQVQDLVAYPPRMASNADLSVAISASAANVIAGQNVTFTITVTNNGADPAAATVTDALPSGFSVVSCSATGNGACIGNTGAASFYLLQSGESQTVTLVTSTNLSIPDGTIANNSVSVSNSSAVDANAANNSASVSVTVAQPITTTLTAAAASGTYGSSTSLSATLTDAGNNPIAGKTISFSLNGTAVGTAVTDTFGLATIPASLIGINAGSYPLGVTASFAGDLNNKPSSGSASLTISPALLTVSATSASRVYGDPNPAFGFSITGFVNGETSAVLTGSPICTVAADPTSPVGSYPITCAQGTLSAQNYTFTFVSGSLTITPAPLTASAANASRLYADPNPTLTGTIAGIKNGDNITAVYSTTATQSSPVGTYAITVGLVDPTNKLGNYAVTLNNGVLTVSPAPLTVTAANATMPFGGAVPVLSGTITGIRNGDNITATYTTAATSSSPAGTYPITPVLSDNGTGALRNYAVTVNNGVLTITQSVLTVTAANASMIYGDPLPLLTGTIVGIQNGDNITATYTTVATSASPVGTYAIVPVLSDNGTGALANYAVVINNGSLTINQAPLNVAAASASMVYGDPVPALTGAITGIKNGDNITATFSTAATSASPVGTYAIVPTLVDPTNKLGNYAVTSSNGILTINPAPLTVTADSASRLFGTPNPSFSGTIVGIKNSDPITASYSTTATATSPVGTYAITPVLADPAGKLGNYTVTSNNGTLTVNAAPAANFVFVNNQSATANSINGYSVAVDGTLTALAGSPVATGGLGANAVCSSVNRLALSAGNNLLFVSNGGDQTISAFSIDPASGALTAAGTPVASGLTLDACNGISLASTPNGQFLMASSNGQIKTFSIGAGGALTALSTAANSVVPNASMKISANGQFLAVSNGTSVSVYDINPDGSLIAASGSPFAKQGAATLAGLDFSSTSGLLFGAEADPTASLADAWIVGTNGALSAVAGSPFSIGAINSNDVLLSPNDAFLFASNPGSASVSSFSVAAGSLSSLGSVGTLHAPAGMATDRSGSLLFVADDTFGVAVLRINGTGSLSQISDNAISGAGQVQDLVAYPPRVASNADLSVSVTASSPNVEAGQNVTFTITVSNDGGDPAAATVTDALPSGFSVVSCSATGNGACIGNSGVASFYLLQSGEAQTVTLVASASVSIADGTVATNNVSISNSSAVDPNPANNSSSVNITVAQPSITTLAVAPASGTYGGSTTLSATLSTTAGPLSGKTINFSLNGTAVGSAVTNASGVASVTAALGTIGAGSHAGAVTASFAGDASTQPSSGTATLTVNPAPLTVAAANASRAYGDPNPALTGTITGIQNGDNITATYSTVATATSPVGTYAIVPTLSDNGTGALANYTVTSSNGTLTVNPALLTVNAANQSMIYGDAVPLLTGTITGVKNGENITASYSTTASSASPVGTYAIVPAVSDNGTGVLVNYTVSLNNGTLTINPAPLTVTAANASMIYGDPLPAFSGTITGIKNADNITAAYSTTATSASNAGTYAIVPAPSDNGTGKLANYAITLVNGTLTINPAPLTVTGANASMTYGDPLPAFSGTITGIRNADNITAAYSTTATSASNVGTYPITPVPSDNGTGKLANYTVTLVNGTLTINQAPLTVTAANASMVFGDPLPTFSGTLTGIRNGDNITGVYTTTATSASPVGTYPITPAASDNGTGKLANYTVTAVNATLTINPAPLTVTAANATMVFGDPVPALSGTIAGIKNGNNITAVYSTTATSASPVGTYPIAPTVSDNGTGALANYTVTLVNGSLTISPAPLTVTAAAATMIYGDPVPALSGTITGIKNGNNITASYSTAATSASPVGTYAIVPTLSDNGTGALANYTVTPVNGTLTITQASLTVTAANATRLYGDPNPTFTGTISGIRNGDNITASFTSATDPTTTVGNYPIVGTPSDNGTGALANYKVTLVNGTLSITPAALSATANNATRVYGDPNPAFTGTITGLKNGDNITFGATSADPTAAVGTYPIVPALVDPTGKLVNYTVTATNGTLTVTPAALTVTAANASMLFGDAVPTLSGTVAGTKNGDNITGVYTTTATSTSPVGSYPIAAAASDNGTGKLSNYTVTFVNGTLTINPAPLTVTANNSSMIYGDPVPAVTGTLTGVKNGNNITASFSTAATSASSVGSYAILAAVSDNGTGALANYSVTINNGVLTVAPAPLSVIAANASRVYGDPNPAFTGTLTGVKNGDNITASFSSAATAASSVGTYPIVATLSDPAGKLSNYSVTSTNGTLTVTPAPLTAAATSTSRVYGHANPSFSGTISGLKNNDQISATFSSPADLTTAVGTYPILPTFTDPAGRLGNYSVITTGTLTITQAPLSVTLANATRVYGDPNPAFTGSINGIRNNDNITLAPTTTADPTSPVGTYAIVAGFNDPTGVIGNYAVTSNTATLTVTPAPLTIQANNATGAAGQPIPTLTGTITGIKNGDNITASYSTTADQTSPAGTYPITPSADPNPLLANYTVTLINGTLTLQ